jgi:hypothetical protein
MENWYVYYSLPAAQCSSLLPRVQTMQRQLAAANGVSARLERRVDDGTTPTVMEVYEHVADPELFAAALRLAVDAAEFAPELNAARRLERFEPISSCA